MSDEIMEPRFNENSRIQAFQLALSLALFPHGTDCFGTQSMMTESDYLETAIPDTMFCQGVFSLMEIVRLVYKGTSLLCMCVHPGERI